MKYESIEKTLVDIIGQWGSYRGEPNPKWLAETRVDLFKRLLTGLDVKTIIELGCNNGFNLDAISRVGKYELSGVDISPLAILMADKSIGDFSVKDIMIMELDHQYDLVLCSGLCSSFTDEGLKKLIPKIVSLARKYILIIDYHAVNEPDDPTTWRKRDYGGLFPGFWGIKYSSPVSEISNSMSAWVFERKAE